MLLFSCYTSRIRSVRFGKALILLVVHRLCTTSAALCLNNSTTPVCVCVSPLCVCAYSIPVDLPGVGFSALCLTLIVFLAVCLVRCFPFFLLFLLFFSFAVYFFYFFVFLCAAQNQQTKLLHASFELISVRFLADFTHSNVCTHTATYNGTPNTHTPTHTLRVKGTFTHTHTHWEKSRAFTT